jgi:L-asparaginase
MNTPQQHSRKATRSAPLPSAIDTACYAVTLLEDNPLFNSSKGAVFTRDGTNELEASVMVSRGRAKRCAAASLLRRVRNPILLARAMLDHGDDDLGGLGSPDVPGAQGHTVLSGAAAEALAARYGLALVDPSYFFTQQRWDEHLRALEREGRGAGPATWAEAEYLPQGTVGCVALDGDGVLCCATSTGGMTNKLSGRIGDTPMPGAGFWAEEWEEAGDPTGFARLAEESPAVVVPDSWRAFLADCLPTPFLYSPVARQSPRGFVTTRSVSLSGTGNGDSFLRLAAARTVAAIAQFQPASFDEAVTQVAGPGGQLQKSAGKRWGKTGEGEGGIIGIELAIVRDSEGRVVDVRSNVEQDHNCGGMFRAWIDAMGQTQVMVWR